MNSRLDELQAAILSVKLRHLDKETDIRRSIAKRYTREISNPRIELPNWNLNTKDHAFHLYVIRCFNRDHLQVYLEKKGIQTVVHYPIPPHKQLAYKELNHLVLPVTEGIHKEVLSLPMSPVITEKELSIIIETLNGYDQ